MVCPGAPKGLTGSGSGFKVSRKARPWFKILSYILGEPGMEVTTLGHKASDLLSTSSLDLVLLHEL